MQEQPQKTIPAAKRIVPWYADFRLYLFLFAVFAVFMIKAVFGGEYGCRGPKLLKSMVAPDFTVTDLDGKKLSLAELKGKVVLLNFWATWCKPCVAEMPSIQTLYKKYETDPNFKIMAISCDEGPTDEVKKFVADFSRKHTSSPITFEIFHDPKLEVAHAYGVDGFPTTFLIDKKGNVRKYFIGPRKYDNKHFYGMVDELLAETDAATTP